MVLSTDWSQVEVIDLVNDGNGFGFILVGGRSTGVVIKGLIPGGVAERDARLQCGDHVLQIGEVNLRGFSSEQVATVLRQTGAQVRLIVARPVEPTSTDYQTLASNAPIIPTKLLSDPEELSRQLYQNPSFATCLMPTPDTELADLPLPPIPTDYKTSVRMSLEELDIVPYSECRQAVVVAGSLSSISKAACCIETTLTPTQLKTDSRSRSSVISNFIDSPETETYEVELRKNVYGLGITVAGYVCEEEGLSGIFVKSIIEGSAAEMSKQIQINDRIVAVDGKMLSGATNHQAVEILRNTDIEVHLKLERFLRGPKFEHLQVALTELKSDTQSQISLPASPSIATLSWVPPKSDADSIITDCGIALDCKMTSRDTVDSNLSLVLDCSDQSSKLHKLMPPLEMTKSYKTNGNGDETGISLNGYEIVSSYSDSNNADNGLDECVNGIQFNGNSVTLSSSENSQEKSAAASIAPTSQSSVESLKVAWKSECPESEIIVAEINKLSGLGISLEGTVDVECGVEKRPHHYIRSILQDGPVGRQGILKPGDELLQANEHNLQGLKHIDVVKILKELPAQVKLICARGPSAPSVINTSQNPEAFETRSLLPGGHLSLQSLLIKAQSESSLYTSSTATLTDQQRSKSVENVSGLALWSTIVTTIEIEKTKHGFGFSILDYQDPLDAEGTVIVIRGLIPGGSAEATNEIFPGDRLVSVAGQSLHGLSLDEAVAILKGKTLGITKIGICRPLSTSDSNIASPVDESPSS